MLTAVLGLFVLGLLAPWILRLTGRAGTFLLVAGPLAATVYFLRLVPVVAGGERVEGGGEWVPGLGVSLTFSLDGLSLLFALLICGIGTLVVLYTGGYLGGGAKERRFQAPLLAFMASMLGLVLADDVIALFLFWELTSVTSYLLIGFYHGRPEARRAALQALLVTAAGGLALLAGLLLMGLAAGSRELSEIIAAGSLAEHPRYLAILLLVILGAFSKSAQFPFQFWLPGAMEAPAPASAYLHSSTMVKGGVYLLARLLPVLGGTGEWLWLIAGGGGITMVLGAWLALRQQDLKRLLAYSTVSILGTLVFLLGIGTPKAVAAALTLVLAHAFYKGCLFLVAGAVDHGTGSRDVSELRGLARAMPITAAAAFLAAASMAGLPLLGGFVAKEVSLKALTHAPAAALLTAAFITAGVLTVAAAVLAGVRPFLGAPFKHDLGEVSPLLWLGPLTLGALGLLFGARPQLLGSSLVAPAHLVVAGEPMAEALEAWYGFDGIFLLSALTLVLGLAAYRFRERVCALGARLARLAEHGPDRLYDRSLEALFAFADAQTGFFQRGTLSRHLRLVLTTVIALVGVTLVSHLGPREPMSFSGVRAQELGIAAIILAAVVVAAASETRLRAVAALGVVGFGVALVYLYYGAPDLAMTQFVVETLTVVLVVLAFFHLPPYQRYSPTPTLWRDAALATLGGTLMGALVLFALEVKLAERISDYFAESSVPLGHGRNVVNVILVDFRALDTLGEITVLAVASVGAFALLKLWRRGEGEGDP